MTVGIPFVGESRTLSLTNWRSPCKKLSDGVKANTRFIVVLLN